MQDIRQHNALGECRAHPPVPYPQQTPAGLGVLSLTPVTARDYWCGEHVVGMLEMLEN